MEGQYDLADPYHDQSLAIRRALGDKEGQAKTLNNLGVLYMALKDYSRARAAIEERLAIRQALKNPVSIALGQNSLADLCLAEGQADAARAALSHCLALYVDLRHPQLDPTYWTACPT